MPAIINKTAAHFSSTCNYIQTSRPYKVVAIALLYIADAVAPKNELTSHRTFVFIPSFIMNSLGYISFNGTCPMNKSIATNSDVNEVFSRLVSQIKQKCPSTQKFDWEIRVKNDSTVNAYCCPGGKVVITTGILNKLKTRTTHSITYQDLIASVLGHEITHAVAAHSAQRIQLTLLATSAIKISSYALSRFLYPTSPNPEKQQQILIKRENLENAFATLSQLPQSLLLARHSQCHEFEADRFGIQIAHAAKFNPYASITLQEMFLSMNQGKESGPAALFSSHPPSIRRLEENQKTIRAIIQESK